MDLLASLTRRLPEGVVSTHPGELASRSRDAWPLAMLREARGERLPRPMAVVFPTTSEHVAETLAWAAETGTAIVPRGGGSGVCGGAQAAWRSVVLDLSRMGRTLSIDPVSLAVRVEAGARGDRLEAALNAEGLTLGHYPQSLAISSVGGWLAARSAGQASAGYGVIEDLVLGLTVVLPGGKMVTLRSVPRSAAGPDLRRLFVGSEGTLGVITEVVLSVARLPAGMRWTAFRFPDFGGGLEAAREVVQRELRPTVLRLYDDADATLTFGALGHEDGSVLLLGFAESATGEAAAAAARDASSNGGGEAVPESYGDHWWQHRFDAVDVYRRIMGEERMLGAGVIVDTMEVAALWASLEDLYRSVRKALSSHAANAVGCHVSHPYRSGASLYFTFLLHGSDDEDAERRYLACWRDAARACTDAGGTITHHHGVGVLKAPYLRDDLGDGALDVLRAIEDAIDPSRILNPGKLLPTERSL